MAARAKTRAFTARGRIGQKHKTSKGLPVGALVLCADNSGAKILRIIQVIGIGGRLRRLPAASVGDMVLVSVRRGTPDMRKQMFRAVIIRQKKPFRRSSGDWLQFEDNAAAVITAEGEMKGSEIRGPVAREAAERFPRIASASSIIV